MESTREMDGTWRSSRPINMASVPPPPAQHIVSFQANNMLVLN